LDPASYGSGKMNFKMAAVIFAIEKRLLFIVEYLLLAYNIHAWHSIYGTEKYHSAIMCRYPWTVIYMYFVF